MFYARTSAIGGDDSSYLLKAGHACHKSPERQRGTLHDGEHTLSAALPPACVRICSMMLHLNGETHATTASNVAELVRELHLDVRKVAVERNLEIVPRSLYAESLLAEGDRIEIVSFIGGG